MNLFNLMLIALKAFCMYCNLLLRFGKIASRIVNHTVYVSVITSVYPLMMYVEG
ncbi:hypothetical protein BDB00DRAFT_866277, partial [Zychaea mexicana]|uniref:uncharacterized protein n=1 Tax=Zychaea mexicana TaxID=64656 RepID=UPI0022FF1A4F